MKKYLALALCCVLCLGLISCSATADTEEQTTTEPTSTTEVSNIELIITEDEATNIIESMYADYTVNKNKIVDNVIYFSILDNGKDYSTVKVDLVTADGYEQLANDGTLSTFNLLD